MKLRHLFFLPYLISISNCLYSQEQIAGSWSGTFMEQFQVSIEFEYEETTGYSGRLRMYANRNQIQDDPLDEVRIQGVEVYFNIPSKNTGFTGTLSEDKMEISGYLTFPDASLHTFKVRKGNESNLVSYSDLRTEVIPQNVLVEDFDFLTEKLQTHHPQLYAYVSQQDFGEMRENIRQSITEMNCVSYYNLISPLMDQIKCSHTGIRMPAAFCNSAENEGHFFPLKMHFADGKAFFVNTCSGEPLDLRKGAEVVSINGKSMHEIIKIIFSYIPSEGNNTTTKYNEINQKFYHYFNLLDNSEIFEVQVFKPENEEITTLRISSSPYRQIETSELANSSPYQFSVDHKANFGVLKIKSFAIPDIEAYTHWMDSIFIGLENQGIHDLVIDLRDNAGGHPIFAAQLFSYLADKEFIYFKRNQDIIEFEPLYNLMNPNPIHFNGNCFVLVNGGCLSTTGHLISLIRYHNLGVFIGEEPGSTFYCNDFSIQYELPNTSIQLNIPRTAFETFVFGFSRSESFKPEYQVTVSPNGLDSYMELVQNLIANYY